MTQHNDIKNPDCAACPYQLKDRLCRREGGKAPDNCPTLTNETLNQKALKTIKETALLEFARQCSIQEGEGYSLKDKGSSLVMPSKPRIQEIYEFARKMNYKRLGLAFCIGLRKEAGVVAKLYKAQGFEVPSIACKAGRTPKEEIGLVDEQKVVPNSFEPMCNPVFQAMALNKARTDINILLGLCVGHDTLFLKFSEAPCTVLAVKDRLLGHNPLAAVYNLDSYYRSLKHPPKRV